MKIQVQLFAAAKEAAGQSPIQVDLAANSTVAELRQRIVRTVPGLASISQSLLIAVNNEYANNEKVLIETDEVACFPPVSGG